LTSVQRRPPFCSAQNSLVGLVRSLITIGSGIPSLSFFILSADAVQATCCHDSGKPFAQRQRVNAATPATVHLVLEAWDPRAAFVTLARDILHRSRPPMVTHRCFLWWPPIPEPALYDTVGSARTSTEACAA
jgi:hypothetical protein